MWWGDKILMSDIFSSYLQKLQTLIWKWGRHKFISWPGRNKSTVPSWAHKFSLFGSTGIIPKHLKQGSENTFRFWHEKLTQAISPKENHGLSPRQSASRYMRQCKKEGWRTILDRWCHLATVLILSWSSLL